MEKNGVRINALQERHKDHDLWYRPEPPCAVCRTGKDNDSIYCNDCKLCMLNLELQRATTTDTKFTFVYKYLKLSRRLAPHSNTLH